MSLDILLRCSARAVSSTSSALSSTSRISTSGDMNDLIPDCKFWFPVSVAVRPSEREEKRRSLVELRFRPDAPTVFANNALHNRQSDACAFEVPRLVQPLKDPEKFAHILHLEARAVVVHEDYALVVPAVFVPLQSRHAPASACTPPHSTADLRIPVSLTRNRIPC